jgi:Transposase IS116/IS110/IS902 family
MIKQEIARFERMVRHELKKLEKEQSGSYGASRPCALDRLRWPAYRTWYSHSPARARHPQPQASCRTAACRPMDDDSGDHKGTRFIKGDRARARKTLFMAAFSGALHHTPLLKAFYTLLVKRGKEHILAVVACTGSLSLSSTPCSSVEPLKNPRGHAVEIEWWRLRDMPEDRMFVPPAPNYSLIRVPRPPQIKSNLH